LRLRHAASLGPLPWRNRKHAEAHELLVLAERAERLTVVGLDLTTELRALVRLVVPVATRPEPEGELVVAPEAELALFYPMAALRGALPGWSFVSIQEPQDAWSASIAQGPDQRLCLGTRLPAGIPLREILLASYSALAMQAIQIDERDEAGVMNLAAARYWQSRTSILPLTRAAFLDPLDGDAGEVTA